MPRSLLYLGTVGAAPPPAARSPNPAAEGQAEQCLEESAELRLQSCIARALIKREGGGELEKRGNKKGKKSLQPAGSMSPAGCRRS